MRVVVLGAGGFLGRRLAARLAADGQVAGRAVHELVLSDLRPVSPPPGGAFAITQVSGDLRDPALLDALFARPVGLVCHLAATLTIDAEADIRRGLETNVLGLVALLERCRQQAQAPMLLFASSIATYGGPLPPVVGDDVVQVPSTSYGTHKVVAELLLADHSRHGFVDARALRLPIVLTHPGPASGSISDQVSSLIREPLRGGRSLCRMAPDSPLAVATVDNVIRSFLHLASLPGQDLPLRRAMNLPGLTVTPAQIVQAVARHLPGGTTPDVHWQPDAAVQRIVDAWPRAFTSERALALGFTPDPSADAVVQAFLSQEPLPTCPPN